MMAIKRALPRRTFLRGVGAAIALPLLDAMVPAFTATVKTAAKPVRRLAFVYCPNGVSMNFSGINYWKPRTIGSGLELSPILEPLAPFNGTAPEMQALGKFFREEGLYTIVRWNTFFTNPPLCITEAQLREAFSIVDRGLEITDRAVA